MREFQYVEDLADACVFSLENITSDDIYQDGVTHLNVGTGEECSIATLAEKIASTVGYTGEIRFLTDKPEGVLRRVSDCSRIKNLGWEHKYSLDDGLHLTYEWYKDFKKK